MSESSTVTEASTEEAKASTLRRLEENERFRYRLSFAKEGALRWVGHLDLQATFSRTLRRAKLPQWFSKGFHPRPKLVFASALPLGCSGGEELMDLWLREELPSEQVLERLRAAAPPGLRFSSAELIALRGPAVTTLIESALYRVKLPEELDDAGLDALGERLEALLAAETLPRQRRGKDYDLRPLIVSAELVDRELELELLAQEGKNGRIEEVLDALALDPAACRSHREGLKLFAPVDEEPMTSEDSG